MTHVAISTKKVYARLLEYESLIVKVRRPSIADIEGFGVTPTILSRGLDLIKSCDLSEFVVGPENGKLKVSCSVHARVVLRQLYAVSFFYSSGGISDYSCGSPNCGK